MEGQSSGRVRGKGGPPQDSFKRAKNFYPILHFFSLFTPPLLQNFLKKESDGRAL
jgi:hypothetical protein